jgi:surface protein
MNQMFYACLVLPSINVSSFNTSKVTDMYAMFRNCKSLTELNISNFDMSNITDMSNMMNGCNTLATLVLPDLMVTSTNIMNRFLVSSSKNLSVTWGGTLKTFGDPNVDATIILNLTGIWRGSTTNFKNNFVEFANSIGTKQGNYTRTIKIYTNLYNSLSATQKALITDKGYTLAYGTS